MLDQFYRIRIMLFAEDSEELSGLCVLGAMNLRVEG